VASNYFAYNGPMVTTAAYSPVQTAATANTVKTMLQVVAGANDPLIVWKVGVDFDGTGTSPIKVELVHTGTVPATVTAHVAAGIQPYGEIQNASAVTVGSTSGSGYNATAEGTITSTRYGSINSVLPGNGDRNEWSLGRGFYVPAGGVVRIRVTPTDAVARGCMCYMVWEE
jgi:uncharacterized protein YaiE (UPF0345 family)